MSKYDKKLEKITEPIQGFSDLREIGFGDNKVYVLSVYFSDLRSVKEAVEAIHTMGSK